MEFSSQDIAKLVQQWSRRNRDVVANAVLEKIGACAAAPARQPVNTEGGSREPGTSFAGRPYLADVELATLKLNSGS